MKSLLPPTESRSFFSLPPSLMPQRTSATARKKTRKLHGETDENPNGSIHTPLRRSPRLNPQINLESSVAQTYPTPLRRSPRFASQSNLFKIDYLKKSNLPNRNKKKTQPGISRIAVNLKGRCSVKCTSGPLRRSPRLSTDPADRGFKNGSLNAEKMALASGSSCCKSQVVGSERVLRLSAASNCQNAGRASNIDSKERRSNTQNAEAMKSGSEVSRRKSPVVASPWVLRSSVSSKSQVSERGLKINAEDRRPSPQIAEGKDLASGVSHKKSQVVASDQAFGSNAANETQVAERGLMIDAEDRQPSKQNVEETSLGSGISCRKSQATARDGVLRSNAAIKSTCGGNQGSYCSGSRQSRRKPSTLAKGKENVVPSDLKKGDFHQPESEKGNRLGKTNVYVERNERENERVKRKMHGEAVSTPAERLEWKRKKLQMSSCEKVEVGGMEEHKCYVNGWTKEQDSALQKAYFTAKPSPHFWKKVAKMVPGKSAQECFDRVHAELSTPLAPQPRTRSYRDNISPIGSFALSVDEPMELLVPNTKRPKTSKQKSLAIQKTVRNLLRKHSLVDQNKEADLFSVFETSPMVFSADVPDIGTPGSSNSPLNALGFLPKCNEGSSSERNKVVTRLKAVTQAEDESPEVLKKIKNMALHDRYIDHLRYRDARRRASSRNTSSPVGLQSECNGMANAYVLKAARTALISEAKDVIRQFQSKQENARESDQDVDFDSNDDDVDYDDG